MEVLGINEEGMYSDGNRLFPGDLFLIDIAFVDKELADFTRKRGVTFPYAVDSIDEESGIIKAKSCDFDIPYTAIVKKIEN